MLGGVDVERTSRLGDLTGLKVIASGGVGSIDDIAILKEHEHYNIEGVIVGQALYTGRLSHFKKLLSIQHPAKSRDHARRGTSREFEYRKIKKALIFNSTF